MNDRTTSSPRERRSLGEHALIACSAGAGVAAVFLIVWYGAAIILLAFAGLLLGILLNGLARFTVDKTHLGYRSSYAIVLSSIVGALALFGWFFAGRLSGEMAELTEQVPQAARELVQRVEQFPVIHQILAEMPQPAALVANRTDFVSRITGFVSTTFSAATGLFFVCFVAVYTAFDPGLYRRGVLHLIPSNWRARAQEVLDRVGQTLLWWLVAHFGAMMVVGILTFIGLAILGVPLAFGLAVVAALLTFIPNIGPVLSAIPATLLALSQSPQQAMYVVLLYLGVQAVETNLITPIFELKTISLPPALTISVQLLLGALVGIVGLLVASPLLACAMVLVQMLYIENKLRESVESDPRVYSKG